MKGDCARITRVMLWSMLGQCATRRAQAELGHAAVIVLRNGPDKSTISPEAWLIDLTITRSI